MLQDESRVAVAPSCRGGARDMPQLIFCGARDKVAQRPDGHPAVRPPVRRNRQGAVHRGDRPYRAPRMLRKGEAVRHHRACDLGPLAINMGVLVYRRGIAPVWTRGHGNERAPEIQCEISGASGRAVCGRIGIGLGPSGTSVAHRLRSRREGSAQRGLNNPAGGGELPARGPWALLRADLVRIGAVKPADDTLR